MKSTHSHLIEQMQIVMGNLILSFVSQVPRIHSVVVDHREEDEEANCDQRVLILIELWSHYDCHLI